MIPFILAGLGGYLIGSSMKETYEEGGMMENGGWVVFSNKEGKIVSSGFLTENEAKNEMYKIFEKNNDLSLSVKKISNDGVMAKGGGISEKTTYVPNRDVKELMVVLKGELTKISGSDIVDGVYVKNKRGKGRPKKSASASVDASKIFNDLKEYLKKEGDEDTQLDVGDIQTLVDCGFDETDIKVILYGYGYVFADKVKCDNEFRGYTNGVVSYNNEYQTRTISNVCENSQKGFYEMGMKYPSFKWDKVVSTFKIKSEPTKVTSGDYEYEVFLGDGIALGHNIKYRGEDEGTQIGTLDLKKPTAYQKERDYSAGFNGGYWGVVVKDKKNLYKLLDMILSQKSGYLKDLEVFHNGLGGVDVKDVKDLKFKYGGNC
jgi:hypothetical protein